MQRVQYSVNININFTSAVPCKGFLTHLHNTTNCWLRSGCFTLPFLQMKHSPC